MDFINEYWMQFLYWLFLALVTYLIKKIKDYHKILFTTRSSIKNILKCQIIEMYNHYKGTKTMTLEQKDNIESLYTEYKNNGGNGLIDDLIEEVRNIEISSEYNGGE